MLSKCTPISNYVLIKLDSNESIQLESGHVIYTPPKDSQQNDQEFVPLRGTVVALPAGLYFKQGDHSGLKWKTEMELEVEDKVIMRRPALTMALSKDMGSYFEENGEVHIFLKYDEIIVAIRGEQVIVLNGFVIVEPETTSYTTTLHVPDIAKKDSMTTGIVRFIGKPNQEYHKTKNAKNEEVCPDDSIYWPRKENEEIKIEKVELQVGDRIQFKKSTAIPLEQDLFRTLGGKQKLYRMQRVNIQCKL